MQNTVQNRFCQEFHNSENVNKKMYILDKLYAVGTEVVTDKKEFEKILNEQEIPHFFLKMQFLLLLIEVICAKRKVSEIWNTLAISFCSLKQKHNKYL